MPVVKYPIKYVIGPTRLAEGEQWLWLKLENISEDPVTGTGRRPPSGAVGRHPQRADSAVVTGAMLAPLYQRGDLSASEIDLHFGTMMTTLVERASSDRVLRTDSDVHRVEDLRQWVRSMSDDLRTVVLRLGLRLSVLEGLVDEDTDDGHRQMARETLQLYVPLADGMGMGSMCMRLEDVCFRILQPALYAELASKLEPIQEEDRICLTLLKDGIGQLLKRRGVKAAIQGRAKGLYKSQEEGEAEGQRQLDWLRGLLPEAERSFRLDDFLEHLYRQVYDHRPAGVRKDALRMAPAGDRPRHDLTRNVGRAANGRRTTRARGGLPPPDQWPRKRDAKTNAYALSAGEDRGTCQGRLLRQGH